MPTFTTQRSMASFGVEPMTLRQTLFMIISPAVALVVGLAVFILLVAGGRPQRSWP